MASSTLRHFMADGGTTQASIDAGTYAANTLCSSRQWPSRPTLCRQPSTRCLELGLSATMPTADRLTIGASHSGAANFLNGHIRRIAYPRVSATLNCRLSAHDPRNRNLHRLRVAAQIADAVTTILAPTTARGRPTVMKWLMVRSALPGAVLPKVIYIGIAAAFFSYPGIHWVYGVIAAIFFAVAVNNYRVIAMPDLYLRAADEAEMTDTRWSRQGLPISTKRRPCALPMALRSM